VKPAVTKQRRLSAAKRQQQILEIATDEFLNRGYAGAAMSEIARRAVITKTLIYQYYESKDELYAACQHALGEPLVARVAGAMATSTPGIAMPIAVAEAIFHVLEHDRRAWTLLTDRSLPRDGPVAASTERYRSQLVSLAAEGTTDVLAAAGLTDPADLEIATRVWIGTVETLVAWWIQHPDETATDMTQRFIRLTQALSRIA
jgi:AcrR family transcriptional regulator